MNGHQRARGCFAPILAIETSCDETAAAVLDEHERVLANIISSQQALHERFGGVVPELASRAHIQNVEHVTAQALREAGLSFCDLRAIAVTQGPGLAGALLVGLSYAKALGYALEIPLVGVSHLEGHIASAWIDRPSFPRDCAVLIASGGHTHLFHASADGLRLMGRTIDDAAGEAFDKGAQLLGLGYPGGPRIDKAAQCGRPDAVRFPRSRVRGPQLNFSFSGLKTALLYHLRDMSSSAIEAQRNDLAAGYQEAIVDVLERQAFAAVRQAKVSALAVVGGVSANSRLRTRLTARATIEGIELALPSLAYCTDNAAMIAAAGLRALAEGRRASIESEAIPNMVLPITPQNPHEYLPG
ncbi:MAG: tRNA (adenosine(37)-N6)-threonylcarbamoyltransferase complex transferase subunit TsaD [Nitrospirales bacterium]|nr:tRNA (adenosine(37)-N6)-threonylcarbamoyltransferase complex transferase subunit TsaD [Nitrospirales bacterium]